MDNEENLLFSGKSYIWKNKIRGEKKKFYSYLVLQALDMFFEQFIFNTWHLASLLTEHCIGIQ